MRGRKRARNELTLYAQSIYSLDDLPSPRPHVTANENSGGARFAHDLSERIFLFSNTDFMSDGLQDLNLRFVLGEGVGYHTIKRERITLDLLGGMNFTHEDYAEIQRNLAAGQVGEEFKLKLGKNTSMIQNLAFFPEPDTQRRQLSSEFQFWHHHEDRQMVGMANVSDTYVTNPPAGKKQNELVITGLRLEFFH